jgi:hypothetical protein
MAYTTRAKLTAYLTKTGSSRAAFATKYPAPAKALAARRRIKTADGRRASAGRHTLY